MQCKAVLHGDGPLLVLAGAGSGKTRTLTHRVAHLIGERGVPPHRILAVTFTNKAAGEMRDRIAALLGDSALPWVSTFHSMCARLLRREIGALGWTSDFVIYDEQDRERLLRECLRELSIVDAAFGPRVAAARIDAAKNQGLRPEDLDRSDPQGEAAARAYALYQAKLRKANAVDFGDLLLCTVELFKTRGDILDRYRERFLHILVDEYQDTNSVQYRLTNLLASRHRNLCVVGDDDQSIYRWRGAEVGNILDFERDYPSATVIRLEQNYRSTGTILEAAGEVVAHNQRRKGKTLWTANPKGDPITLALLEDDREEARFVAAEIARLTGNGCSPRECAVFYRTNFQSRVLEEALVRRHLPYAIIGGVKFFARAEVKDIIAYLRILVNPRDSLSAKRIINVPARGIGAATVARIEKLAEEAAGFFPACALAVARGNLPARAAQKVAAFVDLVESFRRRLDELPYAEVTARIVEETGYGPALRREESHEARGRLENLDELLRGMEEHAAADTSLQEYLEQVALITDLDRHDARRDRVTLMTLHSAKGLEFPFVFMTGMEEGLFPHARVDETDIEEERRLCYVGMTRAMRKLHLTHARRRRVYGGFQFNHPSRFLDEIPPRLIARAGGGARIDPTWSRAGDDAADEETDGVRVVYEDGLHTGSRVRHAAFGVGIVKGVEGSGEDQKVTVVFRSAGRKKLVLRFAGLEPA